MSLIILPYADELLLMNVCHKSIISQTHTHVYKYEYSRWEWLNHEWSLNSNKVILRGGLYMTSALTFSMPASLRKSQSVHFEWHRSHQLNSTATSHSRHRRNSRCSLFAPTFVFSTWLRLLLVMCVGLNIHHEDIYRCYKNDTHRDWYRYILESIKLQTKKKVKKSL